MNLAEVTAIARRAQAVRAALQRDQQGNGPRRSIIAAPGKKEGLQPFPLGVVEAEKFREVPTLVIALQSNQWMVPLWGLHAHFRATGSTSLRAATTSWTVRRGGLSTARVAPPRSRRLVVAGCSVGQTLIDSCVTLPGQGKVVVRSDRRPLLRVVGSKSSAAPAALRLQVAPRIRSAGTAWVWSKPSTHLVWHASRCHLNRLRVRPHPPPSNVVHEKAIPSTHPIDGRHIQLRRQHRLLACRSGIRVAPGAFQQRTRKSPAGADITESICPAGLRCVATQRFVPAPFGVSALFRLSDGHYSLTAVKTSCVSAGVLVTPGVRRVWNWRGASRSNPRSSPALYRFLPSFIDRCLRRLLSTSEAISDAVAKPGALAPPRRTGSADRSALVARTTATSLDLGNLRLETEACVLACVVTLLFLLIQPVFRGVTRCRPCDSDNTPNPQEYGRSMSPTLLQCHAGFFRYLISGPGVGGSQKRAALQCPSSAINCTVLTN
jgi:hypothetical protein